MSATWIIKSTIKLCFFNCSGLINVFMIHNNYLNTECKHSNRIPITSTPYLIATPARVSILETRWWMWLDPAEEPGEEDGDDGEGKDEVTLIVAMPSISVGRRTFPSKKPSAKSWKSLRLIISASISEDKNLPLARPEKPKQTKKSDLFHIRSPNLSVDERSKLQNFAREGELYRIGGTSQSKKERTKAKSRQVDRWVRNQISMRIQLISHRIRGTANKKIPANNRKGEWRTRGASAVDRQFKECFHCISHGFQTDKSIIITTATVSLLFFLLML